MRHIEFTDWLKKDFGSDPQEAEKSARRIEHLEEIENANFDEEFKKDKLERISRLYRIKLEDAQQDKVTSIDTFHPEGAVEYSKFCVATLEQYRLFCKHRPPA